MSENKTLNHTHLVVRPVQLDDLDDVLSLARLAGQGMTSLPADRTALAERIERSVAGFRRARQHEDDFFLLVMEDQNKQKVVGTAAMFAHTAASQAFYAYRLMTVMHYSHSLDKRVRCQLLHLSNDYSGCSEVGALFIDPDYRGNGHWLARSRYLLMGLYPHRFAESVIAELRGWIDEQGNSPFWEAIGAHFFEMDYRKADELCALGSNQFITELMPRHPIYTRLLPDTAIEVIGKPADAGRRAKQLLEQEGFRYEDVVDIFDAGPLMRAEIAELQTVRGIRRVERAIKDSPYHHPEDVPLLLANPDWHNFRVIHAAAPMHHGHVVLTPQQNQRLQLADDPSLTVALVSDARTPNPQML